MVIQQEFVSRGGFHVRLRLCRLLHQIQGKTVEDGIEEMKKREKGKLSLLG